MGRIKSKRVEGFFRVNVARINVKQASELTANCVEYSLRIRRAFARPWFGLADEGKQPLCCVLQALIVARRQDHDLGGATALLPVVIGPAIDPFLQDDMSVCTACPKGRHAGTAQSCRNPGRGLLLQGERRVGQVDIGVKPLRMQTWHQSATLHLQDNLRKARNSGGGFQVADIGFDRSQSTKAGRGGICSKGLRQPVHLYGVAKISAGAVRLNVADRLGIQTGLVERRPDHILLRLRVGNGIAVGASAMVDRASPDQRVDPVAVRKCLGQRLQQNATDTLAGNEPVRAFAKAPALAGRAEHVSRTQLHVARRMQVKIDAAGNRHGTAAGPQVLAGFVDCGQRRRTHGVDRKAGARKVEDMGNPVGDAGEGCCRAHGRSAFGPEGAVKREPRLGDPGKDADPCAAVIAPCDLFQAISGVARVFHRLPRTHQEQTLLRVHGSGIARRELEEQRVELGKAVEKRAPFRIAFADAHSRVGIGFEEPVKRPAVRRDLAHRIVSG